MKFRSKETGNPCFRLYYKQGKFHRRMDMFYEPKSLAYLTSDLVETINSDTEQEGNGNSEDIRKD